ncbi:hypothetical protein Tco_0427773 [Tanacetum coccineum]
MNAKHSPTQNDVGKLTHGSTSNRRGSHATFNKIGSPQWGRGQELEDDHRVNGKVFQIRAKELFVWISTSFIEAPEVGSFIVQNDESVNMKADINGRTKLMALPWMGCTKIWRRSLDRMEWKWELGDGEISIQRSLDVKRKMGVYCSAQDLVSLIRFISNSVVLKFNWKGTPSYGSSSASKISKLDRKRANLSVKGIMIEGEWVDDPIRVKDEFRNHFADRFNDPGTRHGRINFSFPNRLTFEQVSDLEASVSDEEIRKGFGAVEGTNLQTAFLPNRQILDGPFIINEILARCKHKNQQAMFFKVDFAKAYDSIRWDYLDDFLKAFWVWVEMAGPDSRSPLHLSSTVLLNAGLSINLKKVMISDRGFVGRIVFRSWLRVLMSVMKTPFYNYWDYG